MKTKFIQVEGIPEYLLADGPVETEIVDIDSEWADYDAINNYIEELQKQWAEEADFYASLAGMSVGGLWSEKVPTRRTQLWGSL